MVKCRTIKNCVQCVLKGCLWTNLKAFPCRSNPNETDGKIIKECNDANDNLNKSAPISVPELDYSSGTVETGGDGVEYISMLAILIAICMLWFVGYRTAHQIKKYMADSAEWIHLRTFNRVNEKLLDDQD